MKSSTQDPELVDRIRKRFQKKAIALFEKNESLHAFSWTQSTRVSEQDFFINGVKFYSFPNAELANEIYSLVFETPAKHMKMIFGNQIRATVTRDGAKKEQIGEKKRRKKKMSLINQK